MDTLAKKRQHFTKDEMDHIVKVWPKTTSWEQLISDPVLHRWNRKQIRSKCNAMMHEGRIERRLLENPINTQKLKKKKLAIPDGNIVQENKQTAYSNLLQKHPAISARSYTESLNNCGTDDDDDVDDTEDDDKPLPTELSVLLLESEEEHKTCLFIQAIPGFKYEVIPSEYQLEVIGNHYLSADEMTTFGSICELKPEVILHHFPQDEQLGRPAQSRHHLFLLNHTINPVVVKTGHDKGWHIRVYSHQMPTRIVPDRF